MTLRLLKLTIIVFLSSGCNLLTPLKMPTSLVDRPKSTPLPLSESSESAIPSSTPRDQYTQARVRMVTNQIEARGIIDRAVLDAMRFVPRHLFVPPQYLDQAYEDHPLPIGYGQTISQPYIVALMTEALIIKPGDHVLEIGTGSGYQAAVLAHMGMEVYTIEIIPELAEQASTRLSDLGYDHIHLLNADGYSGWEDFAPYDAIIVTAAPDHLPQPLVKQLKEGGHLIIPIGPIGAVQTLWLIEKDHGEVKATNLGAVRFVPLTGDH